ncbi:cathepsin CPL [Cardiosporidium cionae]|uniref:Cathepsin CPL n=1 Tax=Cardiosporidium cionae TaxID=476202 RepID=A0ABQ7JBL7_9APIC|nr:cathepsin CPL [Cardiosporidium cionae]|eukprot:KAF8821402.1 cathepsin CPL [Cardiosporidium cionae]
MVLETDELRNFPHNGTLDLFLPSGRERKGRSFNWKKVSIIAALVLLLTAATTLVSLFFLKSLFGDTPKFTVPQYHDASADKMHYEFSKFMSDYGKKYQSFEDFKSRYAIWKTNMNFIQAHNSKGHHSTLKMNAFGDMSAQEFKNQYLGYAKPKNLQTIAIDNEMNKVDIETLPKSVDWRKNGCVTPVKDQGMCGSCWAFSTTGAIESAVCIATGKLYSLSEQQLVDCSNNDGNQGCSGGEMQAAFTYVIQDHGLCTESDYPYLAHDQSCQQSSCHDVAPISGFKGVQAQNPSALIATIALRGPAAVAVDGGGSAFRFYSGGILDIPCEDALDHAVLAVGYGTDKASGEDYWIVKNSWGAGWGENGYIRLARKSKDPNGECGILEDISYPVELLMASNFFDTKGTKVVCVGQNYRTHCEEMGSPIPEVPLLFVKPGSALTFASLPLAIPTDVGEIHHEVELAVCINKEMKNITSEKALDFVKGYTVAIDVTAREIQKVEKSKGWPWTLSKCQDGFAPIMETIVPPQKIDVNNTGDMHFVFEPSAFL